MFTISRWIATAALTLLAFGPARASDPVARLESRLKEQHRRIEALERQLVAAADRDLQAQRSDALVRQIREVLSEREYREQLLRTTLPVGYDKGFYIRSSDDAFSIKVNGRVQVRFTHYNTRTQNRYLRRGRRRGDRTGFDLQRIRLGFKGRAYDKNLTYRLEFQGDGSGQLDVKLRYAWINYRLRDELQIMAGIFKIASTRGQMTSSSALQFVDRSVTDAVFELSRGLGVRLWGRLFAKRLDYYLDIVNSFNSTSNRTITPDPREHDNNPGVVLHFVWHALAADLGKDFRSQADLAFHDTPVLDLGFHYAFNEDDGDTRTTRIPVQLPRRPPGVGGFGLVRSNGLQLHQFGLEAAFKFRGFSASGEYFLRLIDVRGAGRGLAAPLFLVTGDGSTVAQQGAYVQVGYFLPIPGLERKLEAVARVGGVSVNTSGSEGTWEYAGGLNYYIEGNKVKLQTDVTRVPEVPISSSSRSLANVNDDALIFRVQLQVAF